ncbi:sulfurtransferase [candidate division KSB1 bacterium]|nr:sulfurtransferase [bacterium]NUM66925.1 sulfurtransferase [candidate division KSB1 bacterium]
MKQIDPVELHQRQLQGEAIVLLDVREQSEVDHCKIEGALHIPMRAIPHRLVEMNPEDTIVVYCHHGGRSMQVCRFLEQKGFKNVMNLRGGIAQWSQSVDPSVPAY